MFEAFGERDYRRFWVAQFLSNVGSWMQSVAQAWLVYRLSHSAFLLGVVAFASTAPGIVLMLPGGVLADQLNRRRVVVVSQCAQALAALFVAVMIFQDAVEIWHVALAAAVSGTAMSFSAPAWQAMAVDLLDDRSRLPNAVVMNSLQFNLARAVGPVLAAVALSRYGAAWCFVANALSFVPLIFVLESFRHRKQHGEPGSGSILEKLIEGFAYVRGSRVVTLILAVVVVANFFGYPVMTLMPLVAARLYGDDAGGLAFLMGVMGAGALAGALSLSVRIPRRPMRAAAICLAIFSAMLVTVALTHSTALAAIALTIAGAAIVMCTALCNTSLQQHIPDSMRGRVLAMYAYAFFAFVPFSNLIAGTIADRYGIAVTLGFLASGLFFIGATTALALRDEP
ncbi:MAG TPA: MFS transporter [Thermoanaerobaculia bacterium]|nr:MFS transporter [Thermoanaerobaculia bacterium]